MTRGAFADRIARIGIASNRQTFFCAHQMGTAAMGADPMTSVVDPHGRVCYDPTRRAARLIHALSPEASRSEAKASVMEISARNQIRGRVTAVRTGSIMAEVSISVEPADLTAVITRSSVERLELKEGDEVTVIIKSTEVMVGKG